MKQSKYSLHDYAQVYAFLSMQIQTAFDIGMWIRVYQSLVALCYEVLALRRCTTLPVQYN